MNLKPAFAPTLAVLVALATSGPSTASAATAHLSFGGAGVSASIDLTYGAATDARYSQAFEVTGISGTFSDALLGISNASILGLVAVDHATPETGNMLAPIDFSRLAVAAGTTPESGGFITYDNLFWPGGSAATATDYPAAGGYLDIYGLMFRIGNGRVVDLWSNGSFAPAGSVPLQSFDYGAAVATVDTMLDYKATGIAAVPEPASAALLLGGLGLVAWRRARRQD